MRKNKTLLLIPAAVLLVSAAGIEYAHANSTSSPRHTVVAPQAANPGATTQDTDTTQQGDQNAPDAADAQDKTDVAGAQDKADTAAEATTPETDTVQQGDQNGPDTGAPDAARGTK